MVWAARLWDSAFRRIPTAFWLILVHSHVILAQPTTTITAKSKTISGTAIVTDITSPLTDCDGVGTCKNSLSNPLHKLLKIISQSFVLLGLVILATMALLDAVQC